MIADRTSAERYLFRRDFHGYTGRAFSHCGPRNAYGLLCGQSRVVVGSDRGEMM